MTGLKVTIVITSFNYARYLPFAIASALAQTVPCEIIVVDDGSTDDSLNILNRYRRFITIIEKANGGEASAMFVGLQSSSGNIIIFLDSDDILRKDGAEILAAHFSNDVVKVQARLDTIGANGENRLMPFPYYPPGISPDAILSLSIRTGGYPTPVNSGIAYSRNYLTQVLPVLDDRFRDNADGYLTRLAPLYGKVVSVQHIVGAYRVHSNNYWAKDDKERYWTKYLQHELDRQEVFCNYAARKGLMISPEALLNSRSHCECRILSMRLSPRHHPIKTDGILYLLRKSISSAARGEGLSFLGKLIWICYYTFLCLAPRWLLRPFLRQSRGAGVRSYWARSLVTLTRLASLA